ncbi:MAG: hypothetical protein ACTSYA_12590 [Candidatus Kariarchaeaceae archaeon]
MTEIELDKHTTENDNTEGLYTKFTEINEKIKKERSKRRIYNVLSVLSFYPGLAGLVATPIILGFLYFGDDPEAEWNINDTMTILLFL